MDHQTLGRWDEQPRDLAYYIEDCRISIMLYGCFSMAKFLTGIASIYQISSYKNACASGGILNDTLKVCDFL